MSEDVSVRLDEDTARAEAKIVRSVYAPVMKRNVEATAVDNPRMAEKLPKLGETAYLEIGSQTIDQIRAKSPELYQAMVTRQLAIEGLADSLVPSYVDLDVNYVSPAKRRELADKAPEQDKDRAVESALNTAAVLIDRTAKRMHGIVVGKFDTAANKYNQAAQAVAEELENGHVLNNVDLVPSQVGRLMEGAIASYQMDELAKKEPDDLSINFAEAIKRQEKFNDAVADSGGKLGK